MSTPRITVALPVYKGADLIDRALDCLQQQTFSNFEAIISVDGGDEETAAACRPFLTDPRFRIKIHSDRLDWIGNFNWLLQRDMKEFFCYRQHDDTTAPEFFEVLLEEADKDREAAAIYCDCQFSGMSKYIEKAPTIKGTPLDRMFQYVLRLPNQSAAPVRGLIRKAAIRQAGLVRADEFRAALQIYNWLGKLLHWGNFRRIAQPLYYRLDHPKTFTREYYAGSEDRKLATWTTMFTGLLDAALPLCRTPEERLFFQQAIFDRVVAYPRFQVSNSEKLIAECLGRLKTEGNMHLLDVKEYPPILESLQNRVDKIRSTERTRMGRGISQIRQRYRFAKVVCPGSRLRRVTYQIRHLLVDGSIGFAWVKRKRTV
ncbi:MAG TPA: glycosyltransferase family 2 protein [Pseudolabrys sp.]|nr:glycosyltransferase family 2 protein [Pseudolabrys sp.]